NLVAVGIHVEDGSVLVAEHGILAHIAAVGIVGVLHNEDGGVVHDGLVSHGGVAGGKGGIAEVDTDGSAIQATHILSISIHLIQGIAVIEGIQRALVGHI